MDRFDIARAGGLSSDGPVAPGFVQGWALHPFVGRLVHYWTVESLPVIGPGVRTACGLESNVTQRVPLLGPGNYPNCQRCDAVILREGRTRIAREYPEWVKP